MEAPNVSRRDFDSREALAEALAGTVAARLRKAIAARRGATLAVSGGTTPALFFEQLSREDLDWEAVDITLIDERFVPETSPRSNASLVNKKLLQNRAAAAQFRPLYRPDVQLEKAAQLADDDWDAGDDNLDVAVLGMGSDGHTASFFPDAENLEALLEPGRRVHVDVVHAESAGEPRLTMTLAAIAHAGLIVLHVEGVEKQETLEKALSPGSTLPIRRVIDATHTPVEIFWAP